MRGVSAGFEDVAEALIRLVAARGPGSGAGFAVVAGGRTLVDVCAGEAAPGRAWTPRTVSVSWSTIKPLVAVTVLQLHAQGRFDVDRPIADVWPEFAAKGKSGATARHVLTHSAGLPWWPGYAELVSFGGAQSWQDLDKIESALAEAPAQWEPGRVVGYHAFTFGWILEGAVRRATGASLTEHLAQQIAEPLGLTVSIGLPHEWREDVAVMNPVVCHGDTAWADNLWDPETLSGATLLSTSRDSWREIAATANGTRFASSTTPAANGFLTAHALAAFWDAFWSDPRFLPAREECARTPYEGEDLLLRSPVRRMGACVLSDAPQPWESFPQAWGHGGLGGQMGFGDPEHRIGVAFVSNTPSMWNGPDPEVNSVVTALAARLETLHIPELPEHGSATAEGK